jgi:hypothetical protein
MLVEVGVELKLLLRQRVELAAAVRALYQRLLYLPQHQELQTQAAAAAGREVEAGLLQVRQAGQAS